MASGRRPWHVVVACDRDPMHSDRGGCGRPIAEITADGTNGDATILGTLVAQNRDPGGTLTTMVPGMRTTTRRRGAIVVDSTDPADRPPPQLRVDLLEARRLAHQAGVPFPDGVPYANAVAAEIAKHERLTRKWDPAGTSSGMGRRTFECYCGRRRVGQRFGTGPAKGPLAVVVTQTQLNAAYRQAVDARRRRITLDDLRRAAR